MTQAWPIRWSLPEISILDEVTLGQKVKWSEVVVTQSCPALCDPMDCSLPGSSIDGILQARILEWVAISFSRVFPTQRLKLGLQHCRQILYHLSHQESQLIHVEGSARKRLSTAPVTKTWIYGRLQIFSASVCFFFFFFWSFHLSYPVTTAPKEI